MEGRPGVSLFLSHEALSIAETAECVTIAIAPFEGETRKADTARTISLDGRYVVGCDGANSLVRQTMESPVFDHGFDAQWLVVDVRPHDVSNLPIPDAAQWCNPERPTTIVPSGVTNRRWEFMIKPGERAEDFASEEKAWELLSRWIKPSDGVLVRHAVYRFRSLLARGWRKGRMMIAGDAAHLMPPFMGQGMCSGLRDSWNLAWKLDRVLSGQSGERLLDDYERERAPHVDGYIRISMEMGKVVCVPDPQAARGRDAAFFSGLVPPPPPLPGLVAGLIAMNDEGAAEPGAGALLPHDELITGAELQRLDDIVGQRFHLIVAETSEPLDAPTIDEISELGVVLIRLGEDGRQDVNGRLTAWLKSMGAIAVLARPDFYAFGLAKTVADIPSLVARFRTKLAALN